MSSEAFGLLGLDARTATVADVKRAYAVRLKAIRPETDRDGFMALRQAFEQARSHATYMENVRASRIESRKRKAEDKQAAAARKAAPAPVAEAGAAELIVVPAQPVAEKPRPRRKKAASTDQNAPLAVPDAELEKAPDPVSDASREPFEWPAKSSVPPPSMASSGAEWAPDDTPDVFTPLPPEAGQPVAQYVRPAAETAMDDIEAMLDASPWRTQPVEAWREILDRDDLQPLDEFQDFSDRLRWFVLTQSGHHEGETPKVQAWMTGDVMKLLDERFGWTRSYGRNPWEQAQSQWLVRLYNHFDWFHTRPSSAMKFGSSDVIIGGYAARPYWAFHPALVIGLIAIYFWVGRISDLFLRGAVGSNGFQMMTAFYSLVGIALLLMGYVALGELISQTWLYLKRAVGTLFGKQVEARNWFTPLDWLALGGVIFVAAALEPLAPG